MNALSTQRKRQGYATATLAFSFVCLELFDLDVARACADADGGAAAIDRAAYVMTVEAALHGDRLSEVDTTGAGVSVEVEVSVADGKTNGAAAGGELPVGGGLTLNVDVAAAGACFERSGYTFQTDAAAASFGFDVARASLLELNVAGAGTECGGTLNAVGTNGARTALRFDGGAYVLNLNVAGAGGGADG
jgi:hypothetical protein